MKKNSIKRQKGFITLVFTLFLYFTLCGQALAVETIKGDNEQVKQTVEKYFDTNFEGLKGTRSVNYNDIINNCKFQEFVDLNTQFKSTLNNKLNRSVECIDYNITYNSIDIKNNECAVNLHLDTKIKYIENSQKTVDTDDESHILLLKKSNDHWFVEVDAFDPLIDLDESVVKDSNYVQDEIDTLKNAIKGIDNRVEAINSIKNISTRPKRSPQGYDRSAAARYAEKHAHSYNPQYPNLNKKGVDCTNFVSQCLANAGIPSSTKGKWYCRKNGSDWDCGDNWIRVEGLCSYLCGYGYASKNEFMLTVGMGDGTQPTPVLSKARVGDIVQLKRIVGKGRYSHSIIINQITNGELYYCGHSNDTRTGSFRKKILQSHTYDYIRLLHITY